MTPMEPAKLVTKAIEKIKKRNRGLGKPDAFGANVFVAGWSKENLDYHWDKHKKDYQGRMTRAEYKNKALDLLQSAVDDDIIQGYLRDDYNLIRFDGQDYAIGNPFTGIVTMFPASQRYFDRWRYVDEDTGEDSD